MNRRNSLVCAAVVLLAGVLAARADTTDLLPAGMILNCTLNEPNLSAKTTEVGDPVLCYLGTTAPMGRVLFPRGAYLSGRLTDAVAPGHFVGKGSLALEFDRLVLPGETILPLTTKVIAVPHYKVERNGKIDGKGHAKRDVVEWMIPILWPIKILTLPARGPYPTLKGETRLTLRLMEDVAVPVPPRPALSSSAVPMPPWAHFGAFDASARSDSGYHLVNAVAQQPMPVSRAIDSTIIVLKDQSAFVVNRYGLDGDVIRCQLPNGETKELMMGEVDFTSTIRINRQRGVGFMLVALPRSAAGLDSSGDGTAETPQNY